MSDPIGDLFHTGIIVDDLHEAMKLLTRLAGLSWSTPQTIGGFVHTPQGALWRESYVTYSVEGPHRVELIQHLDSTAWRAVPGGRRVHHLGFWVDDLAEGIAAMKDLGMDAGVYGLTEAGEPTSPSFHRHEPSGLWFELIEASHRPAMETWWRGGALDVPASLPPSPDGPVHDGAGGIA
jgi:hypothetical protein